jgi:hypothetical protein
MEPSNNSVVLKLDESVLQNIHTMQCKGITVFAAFLRDFCGVPCIFVFDLGHLDGAAELRNRTFLQ